MENIVDVKMALDVYYETKLGVYNHRLRPKGRPLAMIGYHPAEEVIEDSLLEEALKAYDRNRIGDVFKLSLLDYLNLPTEVIAILHQITAKKAAANAGVVSDLENTIGKV